MSVAIVELEPSLAAAVDSIDRVPALVESRDRLLRLIEARAVSNDGIVAAVESDVALVIAVLRLANSAAPRAEIGGVSEAVDALTRREIEELARDADVFDFFESGPSWETAPAGFRVHSVSVQRAIDRVWREVDAGVERDQLLTAALLHDIGKVALVEAYPGYPASIHGEARTPEERVTAERERLGTDHAEVGAILVRRWGLPEALAGAIAAHHSDGAEGAATLVRVADMLAHYQHGQAIDPERLAAASTTVALGKDALSTLLYDLPYPIISGARKSEPCPLSFREIEVLKRLSEGAVYKQIALELALAPSTVRSHLHRIYRKLGVVDRAQAVLLASERGWI